MKKLNIFKKGLSFVTCSALSLGIIAAYPAIAGKNAGKASAKTIAELKGLDEEEVAKVTTDNAYKVFRLL